MILSAEKFVIQLPRPFRIAHGSSNTRDTILLRVEVDGYVAHGEGALPPYYPSRAENCLAWLKAPHNPAPPEAAAAAVALDIARQDLWGQKEGKSLWQLWGLNPAHIPRCARTLSIPLDEAELRDGIRDGLARGSTCFKLKTGSGDITWDERCVEIAVQEFSLRSLSVDANAGWTPAEAARIIPILHRQRVEFVEQPVGRDWDAWRELRELLGPQSIPPLVADESLQGLADFIPAQELAQGVNIKLLKAGGLTGARHWVERARAVGLRVMIGVMVETGIGRTAAAQLSPLADWLDIDPADSIPVEPLSGFSLQGDRLTLSDLPGLGLRSV